MKTIEFRRSLLIGLLGTFLAGPLLAQGPSSFSVEPNTDNGWS